MTKWRRDEGLACVRYPGRLPMKVTLKLRQKGMSRRVKERTFQAKGTICPDLSKRDHGKSRVNIIMVLIEPALWVLLNTTCAVKFHLKLI